MLEWRQQIHLVIQLIVRDQPPLLRRRGHDQDIRIREDLSHPPVGQTGSIEPRIQALVAKA